MMTLPAIAELELVLLDAYVHLANALVLERIEHCELFLHHAKY